MPIVVIERGNDKGKSVKLEPGKRYQFGRDPNAGVTLADPLTSRRHFEIASEGRTFTLRDLSSTNGTFLNDEKVDAAELKVGDKIQAGETILSFLSDQREETAQGLVGKTIGGYKLLERVGRGGMGTVYKANQLSLNRIVALKVLSARLLKDEKFIDRFKSEARAAGALNHPNIVGVYDVGTDRDLHFFSMEFMDGGSVQDLVGKDDKLPWEEALDVLIQASKALIFAEKKGIVHRDVKPDNLMLTSDGQTKLADLGLARKMDGSQAVEEGIFGTPHFISPEQAQGREVDHRADLYSLGATAYRILSGRTPFQGTNVEEIVQQQITAEPPPLKQFAPDAPDELIGVVQKLMKKRPEDRYPSAEELLQDLEQIRLRYHLKVHGGGGGKGVLVAVVVALLAVVAVVAFALTRGNGNGNGNGGREPTPVVPSTTANTNTGPVTIEPDPERIRRERENEAKTAFLTVQVDEGRRVLGNLEQTALDKKDDWLEVAKSYDEVAKKYDDTDYGAKAKEYAEKIRTTIEREEEADRRKTAAANDAWNALKERVNQALDEGRYADALAAAETARDQDMVKVALRRVNGAKEEFDHWLSDQSGSVRNRFLAAFADLKQEVARLREDGRFAEAAAKIREFLKRAAGEEKRPPFAKVRGDADALLAEIREEYAATLDDALAADRELYYRTFRAIRHLADAEGDFPDDPVFDFRFADAAKTVDEVAKDGLGTALYRDRAVAGAARLRAAESLMESLVSHFAKGELADTNLNLPPAIAGGRNVTVRLNREDSPPATREGFSIVTRMPVAGTYATAKKVVAWADFLPGELWEVIFLRGQRFEMSPAEHAAAALFLALTGVEDGLEAEIAAAGDALSPADREWATRELAAIRAWGRVREADDVYEQARSASRPPAELTALNQKRKVLASQFTSEYCDTDYFILVYGHPTPWQRGFPPPVVEDWKQGLLDRLK